MRRLRIALVVALGIVGGVTLVLLVTAFVLVRTDRGNEWVRRRIVAQLERVDGRRPERREVEPSEDGAAL